MPKKDYRSVEFGKRLKAWRAYQGWTQEEMAAKTGFTQSMLSRLELSEIVPSLDHIWRLAPVMQTTPEHLARIFWDAPRPKDWQTDDEDVMEKTHDEKALQNVAGSIAPGEQNIPEALDTEDDGYTVLKPVAAPPPPPKKEAMTPQKAGPQPDKANQK